MPKKPELIEVCWVCEKPIPASTLDPYSPIKVGFCCLEELYAVNVSLNKLLPKIGLCHPGRDFKP